MNNLSDDKFINAINEMINGDPAIRSLFEGLTPRQASYRYYSHKGSRDQYFYTTQKINHKGKKRYLSGIYRYLSSKKTWKLIESSVAGHAKKKDAMARALKKWKAKE